MTVLPSDCHHKTRTPVSARIASSITRLTSLPGVAATRASAALGPIGLQTIPDVVRATLDEPGAMHARGADALHLFGDQAVPALMMLADSEDLDTAVAAFTQWIVPFTLRPSGASPPRVAGS